MLGRVLDSVTEAPVPGALVEVAALDGGAEAVLRTEDEGSFSFGRLPPGDYQVTARARGFEPGGQSGLQVRGDRFLMVTLKLGRAAGGPPPRLTGTPPSLVLWRQWLVAVDVEQQVHAWRTSDLGHDEPLSQALAGEPLLAVGVEGGTLWAYGDGAMLEWSAEGRRWLRRHPVPEAREPWRRFVAWPGHLALVYASHVFEARQQRAYPLPEPETARRRHIQDAAGEGDRLWVGAGSGELGGFLASLDLGQGRWASWSHSGLGVTGVAADGAGVLATWSMRGAASMAVLRRHGPDARPGSSGELQDDTYFQRVARAADGTVYAVTEGALVTLDERGTPHAVAELGSIPARLDPERWRSGRSPGVATLLVVDPDTVAVQPMRGPVLVVRKGQLIRLEPPR